MDQTRRNFFKMGAMATAGVAMGNLLIKDSFARSLANAGPHRFPSGPFLPTEESLSKYKCPDWFRDAKFGIWAVWGPESVPQQGDWYARHLHEEKHPHYAYHVANYGHPSKVGFKDVIPHWKAEKWNPKQLMKLYKKAGARYFCMIAMHHDNFDCFDSPHQKRWNSLNMGPKRDIAGEWQRAAKNEGLHFGMTEHLAASWWFYQTAKWSDKKGELFGVPYDGTQPEYADLYWKANENVEGHYYIPQAPEFIQRAWYDRISGIIDRYHPDLLYSDSPLPYPEKYGRQLVANLYNDSLNRNKGKMEVVYNCKQTANGMWIQDLERGIKNDIHAEPWQTDTCVGDWYYKRSIFENHQYKTAQTIIHMLADIVSKNGNLLLNFPPKPDGTLDDDELRLLDELAEWMPVNGEAIYGTRPWKVYGEGAAPIKDGSFNEGKLKYASTETRFTRKGNTLYLIALGWPEQGKIMVNSLANSVGDIGKISLLGHKGKIRWNQTGDELSINLPDKQPCKHAYSFKIEGLRLS